MCQFVETLTLHCLASPSSERLMGPGRYVKYIPSPSSQKVSPLGNGSIFEPVCIVPGVEPKAAIESLLNELKSQELTNKVPFDEITYNLDRHFQAGAKLPFTRLLNMEIKAGPRVTEVQDISIEAPNAWVKVIDENRFVDLLSRAEIRDKCIKNLIDQKYSIVSKAGIAQDYNIIVKEKSGQEFSLSAAISKGDVQMNGGGDAGASIDETIKKSSAIPVVLGVDFFDTEFLSRNRAKLTAPVFSSTGETRTRTRSTGQRGELWSLDQRAPLGMSLPIHRTGGGEGSNCGSGQQSLINLNSLVAPAVEQQLGITTYEFSTSGIVTGGFSRGPGGPFGVGCQQIPQTIDAEVSFDTSVKSVVRSDSATTLQVKFSNIPSVNVDVNDWQGTQLERRASKTNDPDGELNFKLSGAGVYNVHISGRTTISTTGTQEVNVRGSFAILVQ
jgi:hypothetical protein